MTLHDDFLRALGRQLAARRTELGLTQADVAERLGLASPETISRYERGQSDLRLGTLARLAAALESSVQGMLPSEVAPPRSSNPARSADSEAAILRAFRSLPADRVDLAVRLVEACQEEPG